MLEHVLVRYRSVRSCTFAVRLVLETVAIGNEAFAPLVLPALGTFSPDAMRSTSSSWPACSVPMDNAAADLQDWAGAHTFMSSSDVQVLSSHFSPLAWCIATILTQVSVFVPPSLIDTCSPLTHPQLTVLCGHHGPLLSEKYESEESYQGRRSKESSSRSQGKSTTERAQWEDNCAYTERRREGDSERPCSFTTSEGLSEPTRSAIGTRPRS